MAASIGTQWRRVAWLSDIVFIAGIIWLMIVLVMRPVSLTIAPGQIAYMPGAEKDLLVTMRVNAPVCLSWRYVVQYRNNGGSYGLRVTDGNNREPSRTQRFLRQLAPPSEANGFWVTADDEMSDQVCPGTDYRFTLNVGQYYDLSVPGTYTAEVIAEPVKVLFLGTIPSRLVVSNQATFQVTSSNFLRSP